jgi:hypothetical protein
LNLANVPVSKLYAPSGWTGRDNLARDSIS